MPLLAVILLTSLPCFAQEAPLAGHGFRVQPYDPVARFVPTAVNDNGDVAGNHPEMGAVLITADGTITPLGVTGTVAAMNNRGQMVINSDGQTFLRQADGTMEPRTVEGATRVSGRGINNLGQMVGTADRDAVIWDVDGSARVLQVPVGALTLQDNAPRTADGINDFGVVIGGYQNPLATWGVFRMAEGIYFRTAGAGKFAVGAGLSNTGDYFYSALDLVGRHNTTLLNANRGVLFTSSTAWIRAISPDGHRLIGEGFAAEACPTEVTPATTSAPLEGGVIAVQVHTDAECQWQLNSETFHGDGTVPLSIALTPTLQVVRFTVAGAEIVIQQGGGECEYVLPGTSVYAPAGGGEFRVPITTAASCAWFVRAPEEWEASPILGTGSGEVVLRVKANPTARGRFLRGTVAGQQFEVYQPGQDCTFTLVDPPRLGAGSGSAMVRVQTVVGCVWQISSAESWIHIESATIDYYNPGLFTYEPNPGSQPRTARVMVAGQAVTITQDAAEGRSPLLVEPSRDYGPRRVFRFTYLDGSLTSVLTETQIQIGEDCKLTYRRGANVFERSRTAACTWNSTQAEIADGLVTITADVSFAVRGMLAVNADGRQLGVFQAADSGPGPIPAVSPGRSSGIVAPVLMELESSVGSRGLFRFQLGPATQAATVTFGNPVIQDPLSTPVAATCTFTMSAAGRYGLHNDAGIPPPLAQFGQPGIMENSQCAIDGSKSAFQVKNTGTTVDVWLEFKSTWAGTKDVTATYTASSNGRLRLGTFFVVPSVPAPSAYLLPGLVRVGFPSTVPIDRARVVIGTCQVLYDRISGQFQANGCTLGSARARTINNDLVVNLGFRPTVTGVLSGEQTPQGSTGSGLFAIGTISQ